MTDLDERISALLSSMAAEMPPLQRAPDEVRRRAQRRMHFVTWGPRLGAGLVAATIAIAAVAFLVASFRSVGDPDNGSDVVDGGTNAHVATITVTSDQDGPTATLHFGDETRVGVPVSVIDRGPEETGGTPPPATPDPNTELFGTAGLSIDGRKLDAAASEPLAVSKDSIIDLFGLDEGAAILILLPDKSERLRHVPTLTTPTDLRELSVGSAYRMIVAGRWRDGSVLQFAFDLEVVRPSQLQGRS